AVYMPGVHATIAGVILGALTPAKAQSDYRDFTQALDGIQEKFDRYVKRGDRDSAEVVLGHIEELARLTEPPLERRERSFHFWSSFVVLPIFALANAGVVLSLETLQQAVASPVLHGIVLGLVAGKLIGIFGFAWLATRLGLADLPSTLRWAHIAGMALVAGIGFTVSLFITELAFDDPMAIDQAKIAILLASATAGVLGYLFLRLLTKAKNERQNAG
ncbi:MAG: Na+/H+ antiporter NhaA, partial [Candidatus Korobacteraceae bacterium]